MPFIPFVNTARVFVEMSWRGQVVGFSLHFTRPDTISVAEMQDLADAIVIWYNATGKSIFSVDITLVNIVVTDLSAASAAGIEVPVSPPVAGTVSGASAPNNVTVVASLHTDLRGRSFRGRTYLPGLANSFISGTFITTGFAAAAVTQMNALITATLAAGWTLVVASRFTANAPRVVGVTTPVTAVSMETVIDSQRRRLPGRGN